MLQTRVRVGSEWGGNRHEGRGGWRLRGWQYVIQRTGKCSDDWERAQHGNTDVGNSGGTYKMEIGYAHDLRSHDSNPFANLEVRRTGAEPWCVRASKEHEKESASAARLSPPAHHRK